MSSRVALTPGFHQRLQYMRIPLPFEHGVDDAHGTHSAQVGQHARQLHVHLNQYFLDALDRAGGFGDQIAAMPPQRARGSNFVARLKAAAQQPEGVQLQQPLTFLHIALSAGHVLGVLGVH
jgi:hypothetical protein